jgi:zinc protease
LNVVSPRSPKSLIKSKKTLIIILGFLFTLGTLSAQTGHSALPAGVSRITSVEGVTEYRLSNGLHILLVPDASKPIFTVHVTYLVGSRHESYGETGMAHLLEHLMFKGTPAHPNIPDELSKRGAQTNASTNTDRTNYFETFAATDENLDWALNLESDRMVNSFIAKKDLDSEMTVVRNEFESGENNPVRVLEERVMETAYLWHNYGHPTIGARSDIEKVPIEHLQAFYRTYYQPDNAMLIVAGKFDENKTLGLIQKKFGSIAKPTRVLPRPYTVEPTQDGQREVTLRRVGDIQAAIAAYHVPPDGHPDTVALDMLAQSLSESSAGRLRKRLVDTKLAVGANASMKSMHDPGMMEFFVVVPKDGNLQNAREELLKVAAGIPQEPITEAELTRARNQMLDNFEKMMTDASAVAGALSEGAAVGDWRLLFWERDQAKKVTIQDLQRVATQYLVPSNLTVGVFVPEEKPLRAAIPAVPDYAAVLKGYTGEKAVSAGEQFEPTPANIESRTSRTSVGPIKMAFLTKKTRANLVNMVLQVHFGDEKSLTNRTEAAQFAASLLMRGTAKHDMTQLNDALTENKTQMSVGGGPTGVQVSILSDHEHLAKALELAREVLQEPSFPEQQFDQMKRQMLTSIENSRTEPGAIARLELRRVLSPYPQGHIRYVATLDESLERIKSTTLDDVKKFYRDFFGVGSAEMAFVGDFEPNEVTKLVTELFGNWKSPAKYERVPKLYKSVSGRTQSHSTPDKENAVFYAGMNLELRDDDPNYPGLVLGNYILGGGFLNSRLVTRIRQKEGLSYGVGSDVSADSLDKVGSFTGSAICAPQNEPRVAKDFEEEVSLALSKGFTEEEVSAAKSGYLQSRQVGRSDDENLARALTDHLYVGRDFHWDEQYESRVQSLTPQQIAESVRQFIDPKKIVVVAAGDFAKIAK